MRKASRRLAGLLTVFVGLAMAMPATAADLSASAAKEIRGTLTAAFITAAQLGTEVEGLAGKSAPADFKRGLKALDDSAAAAERLANDHPYLQPGIGHVRTNTAKILANGKVDKSALALMHESTAELHALIINAAILEAVADLKSAGDALDKKQSADVTFYLKNAEAALQTASERGGYHIENDIEEIQAALRDIGDRVSAKVPVQRAAIDERVQEIQAHLFELGTEQ
jgi:hypothetical protein